MRRQSPPVCARAEKLHAQTILKSRNTCGLELQMQCADNKQRFPHHYDDEYSPSSMSVGAEKKRKDTMQSKHGDPYQHTKISRAISLNYHVYARETRAKEAMKAGMHMMLSSVSTLVTLPKENSGENKMHPHICTKSMCETRSLVQK
jgi:hypothetical protein